jgi:hypothetical protein
MRNQRRSNRKPQSFNPTNNQYDSFNDYPPIPTYYAPTQHPSNNAGQSTLTVTQMAGIIVVIGSVIVSGFGTWSNMNRDIDLQKNNLETFKNQNNKDLDTIESNIKDIKKSIEENKAQTQKYNEQLDQRITALDATISQLYQKVVNAK